MFFECIDTIYLFIVFLNLGFLIVLSWEDFKSKEISKNLTFLCLFLLLSFHIFSLFFYEYEISYQALLACLILGAPFLLCVLLTKEKALGMGDVYIFMIMGLLVGVQYLFFSLSLVVFSALAYSFFKYKKIGLKQKIPLVPFITFAIMVTTILRFFLL